MKVLAGFLRTPEGLAAIERAAKEATESDGELHLVGHVGRPTSDEGAERFTADQRRRQTDLDAMVEELRGRGVTCTGHLPVGQSHPADALLHVAKVEDVDLIVIGLRHRSRVGKLVLGSNAMDILQGAECSVLAVKAPAES